MLGPDQPQLDATLEGIAGARRQGWPLAPGGVCLVDVRDLAALLTAAMEPGAGPRRFMAGGTFLTWPDLGDLTDDIIGVKARRVPFPKPLLYATGSFLDLLRRRFTIAYPLTRDAAEIMVTMVPTDDSATVEELGVQFRPVRESLTDALTWLVREGHLTGKQAGKAWLTERAPASRAAMGASGASGAQPPAMKPAGSATERSGHDPGKTAVMADLVGMFGRSTQRLTERIEGVTSDHGRRRRRAASGTCGRS